MRTSTTRLRLSRETVRDLSREDLVTAGGGVVTLRNICGSVPCGGSQTSCNPYCTCPYTAVNCSAQSTCN